MVSGGQLELQSGHNVQHKFSYEDLREWIDEADRLGELERISGANWEQDIGLAATVVKYKEDAPALLFDDIPGVRSGFRVLVNIFGGKRKNMTLGFPTNLNKVELSDAWTRVYSHDEKALIPPTFVDSGPVFENVMMGDDVDVLAFPAPLWHEDDGGRYIGTGTYNVTRDPETGWYNLGAYRVMVVDPKQFALTQLPVSMVVFIWKLWLNVVKKCRL